MVPGGVAEWLGTGLQNLLHRFNSGPRLSSGRAPATAYNLSERALSSGGERFLDAEEVRGSNPLAPTKKPQVRRLFTSPRAESSLRAAQTNCCGVAKMLDLSSPRRPGSPLSGP